HIYCPESGLQDELKSILSMYKEFYTKFKLNNYYFRLSIRGKENSAKFIGDSNLWEKAEKILADVLNTLKIPYEIGEGEAAFYGPKIDIQFKNLLGREETVSTIQVDFQAAIKFDLSYIAENGEASKPVVIHRAPLSTHERFISFILEYYGGAFPVWLAPVQVMLVPVNAVFNEHCLAIEKELRNLFIRSETDVSDNSFNKKIRTNVTRKIPIILIVGNNEVQNNEVTVRRYGKTEQTKMKKDDFIKTILDEIKNREF
ncbi:MAG: Threonyl-tRNA synthetase, partial [uncultured bacterium]